MSEQINTDLYEQTIQLLQNCQIPKRQIAEDTGFSMRWLSYLQSRENDNPGYKNLKELNLYLQKVS